MSEYMLVVKCSLKAYELILEAIGRTYLEFSINKKFTIDDKGYIYFEYDNERVDAYTLPSINFLYEKIRDLNEMEEFAIINQIGS